MSRFQPGQEKPSGSGRKTGTRNKRTEFLAETLDDLDCSVPEMLVELLPSLEPEKRASILMDLMSYLYPKRKALEIHPVKSEGPRVTVYIPSNGRENLDIKKRIEEKTKLLNELSRDAVSDYLLQQTEAQKNNGCDQESTQS